jgi:sporulation protein YlmC with PRC-barrel domain
MGSLAERNGYDVGLHLLDRQLVASDGRLVGKVDDVELVVREDGALTPSALLTGLPALLPRFGRRLGTGLARLQRLVREAALDQDLPLVVDFDLVEEVSSDVRLSEPAHALLHRMPRERADDPRRCRVGDLLGMPVRCADLHRGSKVLDLRMVGSPDGPGEHRVVALLVGPGRPGALFGYDRRSEPGPAVVAAVVHWLHRHARIVELGPGLEIDHEAAEVRIRPGTNLSPLRG